jgi:glycosyltransferase involved in cell wall biosynthesis
MTRPVAFVGPLPPPINGFSHMCSLMLDLLTRRTTIMVFDRAPVMGRPIKTLAKQTLGPFRFLASCITSHDAALYLALSGGLGQVFDAGYLLLAKIFRRPVFIHHHSFAYITRSSLTNRCLFALARNDIHIVLSEGMGKDLVQRYRLRDSNVRVVSNAAFFDPIPMENDETHSSDGTLNIGYLSNITAEKGFGEFFAILNGLNRRNVRVVGHMAGPVGTADRERFDELLAQSVNVRYVGPIYGEAKKRFYQKLDIFVFPTRYVNEAEPLVLHEAMQAGVHIIACDRGAIQEILSHGAGLVFSSDKIVEQAVDRIAAFSRDPSSLTSARHLSLQQAKRVRADSIAHLSDVLDMLTGKLPRSAAQN